jgi:Uma2 family endonuclease
MITTASVLRHSPFPTPLPAEDLPILFQEEEDDGVGEGNIHWLWAIDLYQGIKTHLAQQSALYVFANLNVYYRDKPLHPKSRQRPNVAPDTMVVQPLAPLPEYVPSYSIGRDGPAPVLAAEVLSPHSARRRDLKAKPILYAGLAIPEYLLADPLGRYLPERLLLKRLQPDRTWHDLRDPDGGVTSQLGFRVILEDDHLRVIDAVTGKRYVRPDEAQGAEDQRRELEEKVRALQAQLRRQRRNGAGGNGGKKPRRKS